VAPSSIRRLRVLGVLVTVAGCGRLGFDSVTAPADGSNTGSNVQSACGGAPRCPSGALYCDSFETVPLTGSMWNIVQTNGSAATDRSLACRGNSSLHSIDYGITSGTTIATVETTNIVWADTSLYVRVFAYVPSINGPDTTQAWAFVQIGQSTGSSYGVELTDDGGVVHVIDFEPDEVEQSSTEMWPTDRWVCVQWELDFPSSGSSGAITVLLDGSDVPNLAPLTALPLPSPSSIDQIEIGLAIYSSNQAVPMAQMWFDDLVVSNQPVACTD
jgi:hypothetical protein